jgi:hypothetical protein
MKGDAYRATRHIVLAWLVGKVRLTVELPPHRVKRLLAILDSITPDQKRVPVEKWHQLLGELRGMLIGIPVAKVKDSLASCKQHSGTRLITVSVSRSMSMPSATFDGSLKTSRAAQLASPRSYPRTLPLSVPLTLLELVWEECGIRNPGRRRGHRTTNYMTSCSYSQTRTRLRCLVPLPLIPPPSGSYHRNGACSSRLD